MKALTVKPYKTGQAKEILSWIPDEAVYYQWCAGLMGTYPVTVQGMETYLAEKEAEGNYFPLVVYEKDEMMGHFFLRYTDEAKETLRIGFVVIKDTKKGQGYGTALMEAAMDYGVAVLGANKITLAVHTENIGAKKCYERVGFVTLEGIRMFRVAGATDELPNWEMEWVK